MALNFPNSPTLNQVYTDSTSGFSYQWNGTVWISFSAASSSQIKVLDDISGSFTGIAFTFALTSSSASISPPNAQSLIINLGGVIQDASDDYIVSGSNIIFSTAPTNGLSFSGISLGPGIPVDYANNGNVYTRTTFTATASQTTFTVTGTYTVGYLEVYQNGVRLSAGTDYTATTGTTFVLTTPANLNDEIESIGYNVASIVTTTGQFDNLSISGVSTFVGFATHTGTIFGRNLSLTGIATATEFDISGSSNTLTAGGLNVGIATALSVIVGSAVTINSSGINVTGITTIKNASGTVTIGIGTTALLVEGNARVTGILTVGSASITLNGITDTINVGTGLTLSSSGINVTGVITATTFVGALTGTASGNLVSGGALGTPSSGTLTNATGLPISTGVSGLGAGATTFLATPSSANFAALLTDETGTGANVFATSPTLTDPAIVGTILEDIFTITDAAAFEVDPGNGSIQLITLGASRTPKCTNMVAGESVTLMVDDGTAYTITWTDATWGTGGVVWKTNAGAAPTLNTSGYTVIVLWKVSTQVYGARVGDA